MKKVASIFAVAVMTMGLATIAIENSTNETEALNDSSTTLACDDCSSKSEDRKEES